MKASLGRGKGFLGCLLYVFDAKNAPEKSVDREATGDELAYFMENFKRIGATNGYARHELSAFENTGKPGNLTENRMHKLSERGLVRAIASAKDATSVLQTDAFDDRFGAFGVRREPELAGDDVLAGEFAGLGSTAERSGNGSNDGSDDGRHARSIDADTSAGVDRSRKLPEVVGGNMGYGDLDPRMLSKEFGAIRALRKDIKKPVWHCSLALPEGERLSAEKWDTVAEDFMRSMGLDPELHQYTVVRHNDTLHDHAHIVANRIGMDGSVWAGERDVFRAIDATQALERKYGLVLTPGIDSEPPERKKLTKKETEMAVRTKVAAPREQLQIILDKLLAEGEMTAVQFAESLTALSVGVRANLASTGTMNGFSFEWKGVAFTGSQLGAGYKWASLQKKGVSYDQVRDSERLSRFRQPTANGIAAEGRPSASEHGADAIALGADAPVLGRADRVSESERGSTAAGIDRAAGASDRAADGNTGPVADGAGNDRPNHGGAEIDAGRIADRGSQPDHGADGRPGDGAGRDDQAGRGERGATLDALQERGGDSERVGGDSQGTQRDIGADADGRRHIDGRDENGEIGRLDRDESTRGSSEPGRESADSQQAVPVEAAGDASRVRRANPDWRAPFKRIGAAKAAANHRADSHGDSAAVGRHGESLAQGHASREKISDGHRRSAREVDPTSFLESSGHTCKHSRGGREISVRRGGDEVYRVTLQDDGHWVACDNVENGIGDNIALVMDVEPGTSFRDAVYRLHGAPSMSPVQRTTPPPKPEKPFALPVQQPVDRRRGQEYLKGRGIDQQTLIESEKAGFLRYAEKSVLFVGRDPLGNEKAAARRGTEADDALPKREIAGSDKRFIPVLEGTGSIAYVVDGAVDALALHSMAKRHGRPTPTVYVTGGVGNRGWLERESMQAKLRRHSEIRIAGENEKNATVQSSADDARNETKELIQQITGKTVSISTPNARFKDVAELNAAEAAKERAAAAAKERAAQATRDAVQAEKAIKDEQARRISDLRRLQGRVGDVVGATIGYKAAHALNAAGGDASKVNWQEVEDLATHDLIVKYDTSPSSVAKGIVQYSPGRADPATHAQARQHVAEIAPELQQQRIEEREQDFGPER